MWFLKVQRERVRPHSVRTCIVSGELLNPAISLYSLSSSQVQQLKISYSICPTLVFGSIVMIFVCEGLKLRDHQVQVKGFILLKQKDQLKNLEETRFTNT